MSLTNRKLSRREMLRFIGLGAAGAALTACATSAPPDEPAAHPAHPPAAPATAVPATAAPTEAALAPTTAAPAAETVTSLTMLSHSSPQTESYRRMGEVFKKNTGIGLEIIECPFNELQPKMMTELLAGTGTYDLLPITNAMMYPAADYLDELTDLFTDELKADIPAAAIEHATDLKRLLKGMPLISSMPANFYRKDIYDEKGLKAPTTWDEFLKVAQETTIEASGDQPKVWGTLIEASAKAQQPAVKLVGCSTRTAAPSRMETGNLPSTWMPTSKRSNSWST